MKKQELIEKINQQVLPQYRSSIIDFIKPAVTIIPNAPNALNSSASKFGGLPALPKSIPWPRNKRDNFPYTFLLQVNLQEIKLETALPSKGVLYFFLNLDAWDEGVVIYYEGSENLSPSKLPDEFLKSNKKVYWWKRLLGTQHHSYQIFEPFDLTFQIDYHLPIRGSIQIDLLLKEKNFPNDLFIDTDDAYVENFIAEQTPEHHLLGYYWAWQEPSYEVAGVDSIEIKTNLEILKEANEWILLLQIDSDPKLNTMWADGGKVLFFIKKKHLACKDFSNIIIAVDTC